MNPTLRPDYLARMQETDPEAYRSEVLGEFRALKSSNGVFDDNFDTWDVHLYRIVPKKPR